MSDATQQSGNGTAMQKAEQADKAPAMAGPRLPYHPAVEERFGIDRASWKALCEAIFPTAQTSESIILALSYCRARNLDVFKKNVYIVPIWDKQRRQLVDTVWPGIGELRTTAFRTQQYAGREATVWGPDKTRKFEGTDRKGNKASVDITFPEWAQVTVYRLIGGQRVSFAGPPVYWEETFSEDRHGVPNSMWQKRPRGQLDKCAEAAALRAAFPEEIGDQLTEADGPAIAQYGGRPGVERQQERATLPAPGRHSMADSEAPAALPQADATEHGAEATPEDYEAAERQREQLRQQAEGELDTTPPNDAPEHSNERAGEPEAPEADGETQQSAAPRVQELTDLLKRYLGLEFQGANEKLKAIAGEYDAAPSKLTADQRREIAERIQEGVYG